MANFWSSGPMNGVMAAMLVATFVAQKPFWSHGSRYPVRDSPSTRPSRPRPNQKFTSRGARYAPSMTTCMRWSRRRMTVTWAI